MRQGGNVDLHHFELALQGQTGEFTLSAKTGVIDQYIDSDPRCAKQAEQFGCALGARKIRSVNLRLDSIRLPQLRSQRFERVSISRNEQQPRAIGSEAPRQFKPYPRR